MLVVAPFFTSFLIRTLAWQNDPGHRRPGHRRLLQAPAITDLTSALGLTDGDKLLGSPLAVMTGLTYNFLPFMVLPLFASLDRLDPRLREAAGDLYATPWTGFRQVTLPMSMPGVVAGTLLTFIPAAGDYINSQLLGNPNTAMIGQVDRRAVPARHRLPDRRGAVLRADADDPGPGHGLHPQVRHRGAGLMVATMPRGRPDRLARLLTPSRPAAAVAVGGAARERRLRVVAVLALVYMLLPNLVVVLFTFNKPNGRYNYTWQRFSFDAWLHPCGAPGMCESLGLSLQDRGGGHAGLDAVRDDDRLRAGQVPLPRAHRRPTC